ncbi:MULTISPECIES: NUDIX domain-containing protein [Rhodococcus]|jgi:8-oxo-dGTP pyrophosphatase MutT (NUDIX family)|uniref:ADP-ribose pyrophosphatase n=2 Tax=Rhodococcus erythropolis group TaxID=2840174 RepID=A0A6G9CUE3_RHOER|nr:MULTISPECIES: NUDIX hydrolase [Rhodococcus]AZI62483.1 NUDIX hydrolase [Rhodococcus sp. NJ-530]KLN70245.1 ADP-ribose pyrophosphatase [Rhodococcus erythropolis]KPH19764.1 ADP-ribose pyrophosphatase [Rhodococcus sp. ADH]KZF14508.1 ADP-ribose pyrophosphatase [Rhodococcus sp. EPR-134]MBS3689553.1 NUDIX hydrolase [Rhodococcus qingshengii]
MSDPGRHEFDTLGSKTVYTGAIIALRVDTVAMPGGQRADREVVEHHGAVAVVALDEHDNLVLIHQYRHPLGHRLWEIPAGLLDAPGESPVEAAARELGEETGLGADRWSVLVDVALSPGFTDEAVRVFLAEGLHEVERDDPEHEEADLEISRVPLADAVDMALRGDIVNATAVSGILAIATARATGKPLRPADAPWPDRPRAFGERKSRA